MLNRLAIASVAFVSSLTACTPNQTGPGDDGTDPGDPGQTGPDAMCPSVDFKAEAVTPSISLLIDRSGSMSDSIGNKSRYAAVRDALVDPTTGVVTQLQARAYFGASLYSTDSPCPKLYSAPRSKMNRDVIANLINNQSPGGNTPTGPSIDAAVAAFAADPAPPGSPPIIVLATDGLPNGCNGGDGQQASIDAAAASYAAGIKLFVLAVGNGIADDHLQKVANAGLGVQAGMPNAPYFVANTPADLRTAFDQIIGGVTTCTLAINGTIDESQAMNGHVTLNGQPLTYGTDWTLSDPSTITLLGAACETLKNSDMPTVTATFGCGAVLF